MASHLQMRLKDEAPTPRLKVLIVRVGAMGDVLHGLPAVAALRDRVPDCYIGWAIEPRWKDLLVRAADGIGPIVDRIHSVPTREWKRKPFSVATLRQIATLRREMKAEQYDVCVDLQGSIRSAVIGRMAEAKSFLGPRRPAERQARALYGKRVPVAATHVIEQACELVAAALTGRRDPAAELRPACVTLPVDDEAEAWCDRELDTRAGEFVLLAPTAGWGAKQWPVEKYQALAERLRTAGYTVLVNAGGKDDLRVTAAVAAGGNARLAESSLAQLIALTRRMSLVVGGDTGPVHLAAALGRPVVGLFGPTDPARNGPHFPGSRVRVLRHADSRLDHTRRPETECGLAKITEDEVVAAVLALLGQPAMEAAAHG